MLESHIIYNSKYPQDVINRYKQKCFDIMKDKIFELIKDSGSFHFEKCVEEENYCNENLFDPDSNLKKFSLYLKYYNVFYRE